MNREAFLLRLVAAVFAAQLCIYAAGAGACVYAGLAWRQKVCADFDANLSRTFETATATLLALLGGAALKQ